MLLDIGPLLGLGVVRHRLLCGVLRTLEHRLKLLRVHFGVGLGVVDVGAVWVELIAVLRFRQRRDDRLVLDSLSDSILLQFGPVALLQALSTQVVSRLFSPDILDVFDLVQNVFLRVSIAVSTCRKAAVARISLLFVRNVHVHFLHVLLQSQKLVAFHLLLVFKKVDRSVLLCQEQLLRLLRFLLVHLLHLLVVLFYDLLYSVLILANQMILLQIRKLTAHQVHALSLSLLDRALQVGLVALSVFFFEPEFRRYVLFEAGSASLLGWLLVRGIVDFLDGLDMERCFVSCFLRVEGSDSVGLAWRYEARHLSLSRVAVQRHLVVHRLQGRSLG